MENEPTLLSVNQSFDTLGTIRKAKAAARKHTVLYHCTNTAAFLNIIKTREFWLRNLKLVNDKEEAEKIIISEYERNFFVASFTYKDNVSQAHWNEYASLTDGVLFSVSQDWFYRNATPMSVDNTKLNIPVYSNFHEGNDVFFERAKLLSNSDNIVFCLQDFAFYQILYSDTEETIIVQEGDARFPDNDQVVPISITIPNISGIIKKRSGMCSRDNRTQYLKNWEEEHEVRLKIRIQQVMTETKVIPPSKIWFMKAAVRLSDRAFNEFNIRFSPKYPEEMKKLTIAEIQHIAPNSTFSVLE